MESKFKLDFLIFKGRLAFAKLKKTFFKMSILY